MPLNSLIRTNRAVRVALLIAGMAGLTTAFMFWRTIQREHEIDVEDLTRRSRAIALNLAPAASQALTLEPKDLPPVLSDQPEVRSRLLGFLLFDEQGHLLCAHRRVDEFSDDIAPVAARVGNSKAEFVELVELRESPLHVLALPVYDSLSGRRGVLAAVHDASYLEERSTGRLLHALFWVFVVTLGLLVGTMLVTWVVYEGPLIRLASWMKGVRMGDASELPPPRLPVGTLTEETEHLAASYRAAKSSARARSEESVHRDKVWSRERLEAHATTCLSGAPLIVVSNREPYVHSMKDGTPRVSIPASGLVTAVDPILQACGGMWVAHGSGDADRSFSDSRGRLTVPPRDPRYTLKRIWLSRDEEQGYYYGFSNEGLWPLCHHTHERPIFRSEDWNAYVRVNHRFAEAILDELDSSPALVWVHDYHLALLPQILKAARPDLKTAVFWHIPWPTAEAFRICPWGPDIVRGLLGSDLIGFHLQQHCNNFLDTVDRSLEARLDWDQSAVDFERTRTLVRPFPISVQSWDERRVASGEALEAHKDEIKTRLKLHDVQVGVGVERIDYTKGLPERFHAIARLFEKHPEHRGRFTFVQLGAPSRTHIPRYRDLVTDLEALADRINWKFEENGWKPIQFLVAQHNSAAVHTFLSMASLCVVSSLHDGMNLVAKEYVAAKADSDGVLILSEFAGAARELPDAMVINPYDGEGFAEALHAALSMPDEERRARMTRMRQVVDENNVYRWAASFLSEAAQGIRTPSPAANHAVAVS